MISGSGLDVVGISMNPYENSLFFHMLNRLLTSLSSKKKNAFKHIKSWMIKFSRKFFVVNENVEIFEAIILAIANLSSFWSYFNVNKRFGNFKKKKYSIF